MPNVRKPRIKKNCDWCGKSFTMNTSEYHKKLKNKDGHFFHRKECRMAWEKANAPHAVCEWCGVRFPLSYKQKTFSKQKRTKHFFHTNECRKAWLKAGKKRPEVQSSGIQKASV